jgi:hypothetical protein
VGTRATRRAGVDEPSLVETIDEGRADDGVEDRAHAEIVALATHNLK